MDGHGIGRHQHVEFPKPVSDGTTAVEEAKSLETELDVVEGMQFDRGYISPYFITNADKMRAEMRRIQPVQGCRSSEAAAA